MKGEVMTVYNFNLGIGWASSGVEYAQAYRATIFRDLSIPSKFIFTDMIRTENIQHFTHNIGLKDEEVVWLYSFFTDIKTAPTTYTLKDLENTFSQKVSSVEKGVNLLRYTFENSSLTVVVALVKDHPDYVQRVEYLISGRLIRKDYFSYTKMFSEYYYPQDNQAKLHKRTFFNEDGSVAYDELIGDKDETAVYRFNQHLFYTKEELIELMVKKLSLTSEDWILLDRSTGGIGQAVFSNKGPAKLAVVVHAEHFSPNAVTENTILWNNYYEYQFTNADKVDYFITSTQVQADLLKEQFHTYTNHSPNVIAIPVGSLDQLRKPKGQRKPYALVTASRLAAEKHIDWLVAAVCIAKKILPDLTLDIYGSGGQENRLREQIRESDAQGYIRLMGHHDLTDMYQDYVAYISASTSEGFGLTLMEAVGAGLPIIGLDVRYGNQTFVRDGQNGYLIERKVPDNVQVMAKEFSDKIIQLFTKSNLDSAHAVSYAIAEDFLADVIQQKWQQLIKR